MGRKVNPFFFRLGEITTWRSRWFNAKKFKNFLKEDYYLRDFVFQKLRKSGLSNIEIERSQNNIKIIIFTSRPGLIIGKGGAGIESLKNEIEGFYTRKIKVDKNAKVNIKLQIEEIAKPDSNAQIVGQQIADQIEKRIPFRRTLKQALDKVSQDKDVKGVKVMMSGRLDGSEMARREWLSKGKVPLQTLRSDIDFARVNAYCRYGVIGIKVWIYKGEKL